MSNPQDYPSQALSISNPKYPPCVHRKTNFNPPHSGHALASERKPKGGPSSRLERQTEVVLHIPPNKTV